MKVESRKEIGGGGAKAPTHKKLVAHVREAPRTYLVSPVSDVNLSFLFGWSRESIELAARPAQLFYGISMCKIAVLSGDALQSEMERITRIALTWAISNARRGCIPPVVYLHDPHLFAGNLMRSWNALSTKEGLLACFDLQKDLEADCVIGARAEELAVMIRQVGLPVVKFSTIMGGLNIKIASAVLLAVGRDEIIREAIKKTAVNFRAGKEKACDLLNKVAFLADPDRDPDVVSLHNAYTAALVKYFFAEKPGSFLAYMELVTRVLSDADTFDPAFYSLPAQDELYHILHGFGLLTSFCEQFKVSCESEQEIIKAFKIAGLGLYSQFIAFVKGSTCSFDGTNVNAEVRQNLMSSLIKIHALCSEVYCILDMISLVDLVCRVKGGSYSPITFLYEPNPGRKKKPSIQAPEAMVWAARIAAHCFDIENVISWQNFVSRTVSRVNPRPVDVRMWVVDTVKEGVCLLLQVLMGNSQLYKLDIEKFKTDGADPQQVVGLLRRMHDVDQAKIDADQARINADQAKVDADQAVLNYKKAALDRVLVEMAARKNHSIDTPQTDETRRLGSQSQTSD